MEGTVAMPQYVIVKSAMHHVAGNYTFLQRDLTFSAQYWAVRTTASREWRLGLLRCNVCTFCHYCNNNRSEVIIFKIDMSLYSREAVVCATTSLWHLIRGPKKQQFFFSEELHAAPFTVGIFVSFFKHCNFHHIRSISSLPLQTSHKTTLLLDNRNNFSLLNPQKFIDNYSLLPITCCVL